MQRELIRIGSPLPANESTLIKTAGFDALFYGYHEFVYIDDFEFDFQFSYKCKCANFSYANDKFNQLLNRFFYV
jgi:hypothetical protein